jgi:hypothetical protein
MARMNWKKAKNYKQYEDKNEDKLLLLNGRMIRDTTSKWLEKHDPKIAYKKSAKFKQHQKLKLAQIKASKQRKAQNRALESLRVYRAKHRLELNKELNTSNGEVIWGDKWED